MFTRLSNNKHERSFDLISDHHFEKTGTPSNGQWSDETEHLSLKLSPRLRHKNELKGVWNAFLKQSCHIYFQYAF